MAFWDAVLLALAVSAAFVAFSMMVWGIITVINIVISRVEARRYRRRLAARAKARRKAQ